MNRRLIFAVSLLATLALCVDWAWGRPGGGFGGAVRSGGGGGLRIGGGGGGGFRPGGGMSLRSGSLGGGGLRLSPGIGSSIRSSPGIGSGIRSSAGIGNALRSSPGIGSGIRSSPGIGSAIRSSPGANVFRNTPNLGGGSALSRSLGAGGPNLSRQGNTALRPLTNPSIGSRILSSPGTGARIGGQANLGSRGILTNPGGGQGTGSLRLPFAGRVTSGQLGDFLSLPNRSSLNAGGQLRGSQALNISRAGGAANFRNLDGSQIGRISNNVNQAFRNGSTVDLGRFNNGFGYGFANNGYWNNWAGGVRNAWHPLGFHNCFTPHFWATNHVHFPWARSYYWWGARPWGHWWGCPGWGALASWILPPYGWHTPCYYGYGPGGNVVYQNGYVYINDQPIATAEEYAASAAELADVPAPANPDQAVEWMPLGTFALSEGESDKDPSRVVQLAVDKDGTISGTMVNKKTNQTYPIQGRVDKETQRVAFTIGDNKDVVLETGIYNLTQQQTPVLAHGDGREETYLLLRLDPPKEAGQEAAAPVAPPAPPKPLLP